ncbi:MAG: biotin transporter BioY, partial [Nitrososphaerota archaeon]
VFLGPTGGYLVSFPLAAAAAGYLNRRSKPRFSSAVLGAAVGEAIIYLIGVPWLAGWLSFSRGLSMLDSISTAAWIGMIPFLPWDAVKAAVAVYVSTRRQVVLAIEKYVG